jgi:hypothetical protein
MPRNAAASSIERPTGSRNQLVYSPAFAASAASAYFRYAAYAEAWLQSQLRSPGAAGGVSFGFVSAGLGASAGMGETVKPSFVMATRTLRPAIAAALKARATSVALKRGGRFDIVVCP